jgi:HAD superfamily hydrolase (TIGR01459 family)
MTTPVFDHFGPLAPQYDVLLCDVWGVIHNGVAAFADACDALTRFRAAGGCVVLVTNAPRPSPVVVGQLDYLKVSPDAYDGVVSSGDVTRSVILGRAGQSVFHLGPERDKAIFDGLDASFASDADADYVVCTGLFNDDTETPDDYRAMLGGMLVRSLFMACANPDVVVERGDKLIYCAGALADLYRTIGGEVLYAGKPYAPIYDEALEVAAKARGKPIDRKHVLAIGDSLRTDFTGARDSGLDFLFVTSGIHGDELGDRDSPDQTMLRALLTKNGAAPKGITPRLRW